MGMEHEAPFAMQSNHAARGWDVAAAVIAGGLAVSEVVRLAILGLRSNEQTALMTVIGSSAFIAVLAVAAVGVALHKQVGWIFGVLGFIAAASHGAVLAASGSAIGTVYMGAAVALFVVVVKSLQFYRTAYRTTGRDEIAAT